MEASALRATPTLLELEVYRSIQAVPKTSMGQTISLHTCMFFPIA